MRRARSGRSIGRTPPTRSCEEADPGCGLDDAQGLIFRCTFSVTAACRLYFCRLAETSNQQSVSSSDRLDAAGGNARDQHPETQDPDPVDNAAGQSLRSVSPQLAFRATLMLLIGGGLSLIAEVQG
jgi:hypothetical protein